MKVFDLFENFVPDAKLNKLLLVHWRHDASIPSVVKERLKDATDDKILSFITSTFTKLAENKIDPKLKKDFILSWLFKVYANGTLFEDMIARAPKALLTYSDLLHSGKFIKDHGDLNKYRTVYELEDYLTYAYKKNPGSREVAAKGEPHAIKIVDNDQYTIVIPINTVAACKYGMGTRWCTTSLDTDDYDDYDDDDYDDADISHLRNGDLDKALAKPKEEKKDNRIETYPGSTFHNYFEDGPLIIVIAKNGKDKYQMHAASGQFMDAQDDSAKPNEIKQKFPRLWQDIVNGLEAHKAELKKYKLKMSDFDSTYADFREYFTA